MERSGTALHVRIERGAIRAIRRLGDEFSTAEAVLCVRSVATGDKDGRVVNCDRDDVVWSGPERCRRRYRGIENGCVLCRRLDSALETLA